MQKHTRIYFQHFDIGEQDLVTCECCITQGRADGQGFDVHHIHGRGKVKDVIENLMCLCRKHHEMAHASKLKPDELQLIHNYFLQGMRKIFVK